MDSAAKHTPGPWTIEHPSDVTTQIYAYKGNVLIAQVMRGSGAVRPTDAAERNAALIAAAPEMLDALKSVEWGYGNFGSAECPECRAQKADGHDDDCVLGAAIATAEGQP